MIIDIIFLVAFWNKPKSLVLCWKSFACSRFFWLKMWKGWPRIGPLLGWEGLFFSNLIKPAKAEPWNRSKKLSDETVPNCFRPFWSFSFWDDHREFLDSQWTKIRYMLIPCISSFHMRSAFSLWSTNGRKFFQPALDTRTVSEGEVVKKVLAGSLVTSEFALWASLVWSTSWNFEALSQNRSPDILLFLLMLCNYPYEGVLRVESSCGKCQSWQRQKQTLNSDESEDDALAGVPLPISWEAIRCKIGRCRFAYELNLCFSLWVLSYF